MDDHDKTLIQVSEKGANNPNGTGGTQLAHLDIHERFFSLTNSGNINATVNCYLINATDLNTTLMNENGEDSRQKHSVMINSQYELRLAERQIDVSSHSSQKAFVRLILAPVCEPANI